jgi:hypothetical protein
MTTMIPTDHAPMPACAPVIRAGAQAAREGRPRTDNPHDLNSEDWTHWMDGFDHQTVWTEHGRGTYDPFSAAAADPS